MRLLGTNFWPTVDIYRSTDETLKSEVFIVPPITAAQIKAENDKIPKNLSVFILHNSLQKDLLVISRKATHYIRLNERTGKAKPYFAKIY